MENIFRIQEVELLSYLMKANSEISRLGANFNKEAVLKQVTTYLQKAEEGYQSIAESFPTLSDNQKLAAATRLKAYRQKHEELRLQVERFSCFGSGEFQSEVKKEGNLERTLALGHKSHEVGVKTLAALKGQRDIIQRYENGDEFSNNLNEADNLMAELEAKKVKLKLSMIIIIVLEVIILLLILYIKLG
jgi:hypothetical protein